MFAESDHEWLLKKRRLHMPRSHQWQMPEEKSI